MPTGTALEGAPFASTIGPGVPRGPFALQVHSAFRSALNLRLGGRAVLVTLVGADGPDLPQGIRLGSRPDFRGWGLRPGAEGFLGALELRLERSVGEPIRVDLSPARRAEPNPLAPIENLGAAFGACLPELETEQRSRACDLRVTDLLTSLAPPALPHGAGGGGGGALARAARELGASARGPSAERAHLATRRLVGLGPGSTPAGDDFLCGFLLALRCASGGDPARHAFLTALGASVLGLAPATTDIAATFLLCAVEGLAPAPLADLAAALAADRSLEAVESLRRACAQGHSSGADLCTGFLYGLACWAGHGAGRRPTPDVREAE